MFRKFVCATFVMAICVGVVLADDFQGTITKVDKDKVTVQKFKKSTEKGKPGEKDGEPVVLTVAKDCKVVQGKFDKEAKKLVAGDAVEKGLENTMFTAIAEKGVNARITTEGSNITQIMIFKTGKKKPAN